MKITCPKCENVFEWEPSKETAIMKVLTPETAMEEMKPKRHTTLCPSCKTRISVYVK